MLFQVINASRILKCLRTRAHPVICKSKCPFTEEASQIYEAYIAHDAYNDFAQAYVIYYSSKSILSP